MDGKINKLQNILLLLYLGIFPLGQIPSMLMSWYLPNSIPSIHLTDILILGIATLEVHRIVNHRDIFKHVQVKFATMLVFSFIVGVLQFGFQIYPLLYLVRVVAYLIFSHFIWRSYTSNRDKNKLLVSVVIIGLIISLLGWVQYLFSPDLRYLKVIGWDDHYYRLASTFLDPAFTGIIILLSVVVCIFLYFHNSSKAYLYSLFLLLPSLFFTYSRSSYLSLIIIAVLLGRRVALLGLFILIIFVLILPRQMGGAGVMLERTHSVVQKIDNAMESKSIIGDYPVLGVGYNYICSAKQVSSITYHSSNSCHGLDNSLLFIAATTGVVGLLIFSYFLYRSIVESKSGKYGNLYKLCLIAILVHSIFTNTLFYPWVMALLAILVGISRKSIYKTDP